MLLFYFIPFKIIILLDGNSTNTGFKKDQMSECQIIDNFGSGSIFVLFFSDH